MDDEGQRPTYGNNNLLTDGMASHQLHATATEVVASNVVGACFWSCATGHSRILHAQII
jgi:hypothetical protein